MKKIDAETPPDLDLHLIVDNNATHKHQKVKNWLKRHSQFHPLLLNGLGIDSSVTMPLLVLVNGLGNRFVSYFRQ